MTQRGLVILLSLCLLVLSAPKVFAAEGQTTAPRQPNQEEPSGTAASKPSSSGSKKNKDSSAADEIKKRIESLGIASRVTVLLKNGNEYYGAISQIETDSFQLSEIDLKQQVTIGYNDVKKVRSGFGNPNPFNGKRWRPGWHLAAAIAAGGLLVVLIVVGAASSR